MGEYEEEVEEEEEKMGEWEEEEAGVVASVKLCTSNLDNKKQKP